MKKSFTTSGLIDELNDQMTGDIDTARSDEVQCTDGILHSVTFRLVQH